MFGRKGVQKSAENRRNVTELKVWSHTLSSRENQDRIIMSHLFRCQPPNHGCAAQMSSRGNR